MIYGCDGAWWYQNHKHLPAGPEYWTQEKQASVNLGLNFIKSKGGKGLCTDPDLIHHGMNSGYQAINLAYHWGASRIILIGYDMQHIDGQTHWHGDHPPSLTNAESINQWVHRFGALADDLRRLGVNVINTTMSSALTCFKKQPLSEVLDEHLA